LTDEKKYTYLGLSKKSWRGPIEGDLNRLAILFISIVFL